MPVSGQRLTTVSDSTEPPTKPPLPTGTTVGDELDLSARGATAVLRRATAAAPITPTVAPTVAAALLHPEAIDDADAIGAPVEAASSTACSFAWVIVAPGATKA